MPLLQAVGQPCHSTAVRPRCADQRGAGRVRSSEQQGKAPRGAGRGKHDVGPAWMQQQSRWASHPCFLLLSLSSPLFPFPSQSSGGVDQSDQLRGPSHAKSCIRCHAYDPDGWACHEVKPHPQISPSSLTRKHPHPHPHPHRTTIPTSNHQTHKHPRATCFFVDCGDSDPVWRRWWCSLEDLRSGYSTYSPPGTGQRDGQSLGLEVLDVTSMHAGRGLVQEIGKLGKDLEVCISDIHLLGIVRMQRRRLFPGSRRLFSVSCQRLPTQSSSTLRRTEISHLPFPDTKTGDAPPRQNADECPRCDEGRISQGRVSSSKNIETASACPCAPLFRFLESEIREIEKDAHANEKNTRDFHISFHVFFIRMRIHLISDEMSPSPSPFWNLQQIGAGLPGGEGHQGASKANGKVARSRGANHTGRLIGRQQTFVDAP
jgi:hypothetical protein